MGEGEEKEQLTRQEHTGDPNRLQTGLPVVESERSGDETPQAMQGIPPGSVEPTRPNLNPVGEEITSPPQTSQVDTAQYGVDQRAGSTKTVPAVRLPNDQSRDPGIVSPTKEVQPLKPRGIMRAVLGFLRPATKYAQTEAEKATDEIYPNDLGGIHKPKSAEQQSPQT